MTLTNQVTSIAENTSTAARLKVADVAVTDDGAWHQHPDASPAPTPALFEVDSTGLYLKAGTTLDYDDQDAATASPSRSTTRPSAPPRTRPQRSR